VISTSARLPKKIKRICFYILGAMTAITFLGLFTLSSLETQYSLKQFLPKNSKLLALDASTKKTFQISEGQPFIVTLQMVNLQMPHESGQNSSGSNTWLDANKIAALKNATETLAQLPKVKSALSLATVEGAVDSKEGLSVGPLLASIPPEQWRKKVLTNSLLTPALISRDATTASIVITPQDLQHEEVQLLKHNIEEVAREQLPFAKTEVGGTPAVQADISELLHSEIRNFVGLGFLACLIVLTVVFANFTPVLISLIITLTANLIILASMAVFGFSFSVLSTTIPILATVTVMSLCIHSMLRFVEEEKLNPERFHYQTVFKTLRLLLGPNLLASLTTMIGFLVLLTTEVPLIHDFGLTVAFSIMICWAVTTVLLVPLMILLPAPVARKWAWAKARWGLYLFRKSGAVAFLIVVISIALAIKGQKLSWTAKLFDDLPSDRQASSSTQTIDEKLGGMIPIDLELHGAQDIWNDPALLAKLDKLIRRFRTLPGIGSAVGLPDLLVAANIGQHALPKSKASTAEILFLYSLSDQSPLKNYLSTDSSRTRIALRAQDIPSDELNTLVNGMKAETQKVFPGFKVTATGMGSTIHQLNNDLSRELIFGFWQSMMGIFLILIFVFRSLRWALVSCIPNLVPPAVLLGFLAISETPIKPSIAIIFSIALGMAFNNTVYLLGRLKSIQKSSTLKIIDIEKTLWLEGNPCLISSLTLLAGFSVFLISYFAMNRIFGFYMILSMVAGLIGDLVLLPTLLKSCPWLLNPVREPMSPKKEAAMTSIATLLFAFLFANGSNSAHAATAPLPGPGSSVDKITQEIGTRLTSKDEVFTAKMTIVEADKTSKDREMTISRFSPNKKEHYLLVRMQTPKDLRGTSLLATYKGGNEEKWLFLPSSKQTRRLASTSKESSSILGSELNTEDFNLNTENTAKSTLQKETTLNGQRHFVISTDVSAVSNNYSRVVSYVAADSYLPTQSECYDKAGKLLKTIHFSEYKKVGPNKFRAGLIQIENVQNKRRTDIAFSDMKIDTGLSANAFTPRALGED
jgi:predicted RND superfamily exporter protein/outer membrane lipoprotein-sorting protein